jgi:hypothetical protein
VVKLDLRKTLKPLYTASAKPALVEVPELAVLMVDGAGDPNGSSAFEEAMGALYGAAYTLKFALKKRAENPFDFSVMPAEGLWWCQDMRAFSPDDRSNWLWTLMIVLPDRITRDDFTGAVEALRAKKNPPGLDRLRFERFHEGLSAQIMHVGPYAEEPATIERLHAFIAQQGHTLRGKHHEIYLSDPRRTAPEKLKTILRQPVGSQKGNTRITHGRAAALNAARR